MTVAGWLWTLGEVDRRNRVCERLPVAGERTSSGSGEKDAEIINTLLFVMALSSWNGQKSNGWELEFGLKLDILFFGMDE